MAQKLRAIEKLGLILFIVILSIIFLVFSFGNLIKIGTFNPPNLVLILNILFITIADIIVAVISSISFLRYGQLSFILLTGALTINGATAIFAGWAAGFSANANFTIFSVGMLMSSMAQALGVIYLSQSLTAEVTSKRNLWLAITILASLLSAIMLTVSASLGLTASFFTGSGLSSLGVFIIALSSFFFALGSFVIGYKFLQSKALALYWYSLALGLFAIGSIGVSSTTDLGDISQWIGRIAYYLGGFYFIIAVLSLRSQAKGGIALSSRWFETFSNSREQLAAISVNMLNGFAYLRMVMGKDAKPVNAIFLEINNAFENTLGLKKQEVLTRGITETKLGMDKSANNLIKILGQVSITGKSTIFEIYLETLQKWLRISTYSPRKGYVILLTEDITEAKKSQRKLEEYSRNLEELVEQRTKQLRDSERLATIGQTAGMVGHDIRSPLQAINSEIYLAKSELDNAPATPKDENIKESLQFIEEQTAYIQKIVSDLQDLSRPLKPELNEVDLCSAIPETLSTIEVPSEIKKSIVCSMASLKIKLDIAYLKRIMINLVTNAIQAMPDGGKLTVNIFAENSSAFVTVEDTGSGISPEYQERLFTPLFTTKAKGQGFGLVVIKRMTEALGGKISFESRVGQGTKFTVELPIVS